jgi:hypothetical protein
MTFDYVDCYPALLDELIKQEQFNHPRLTLKVIVVSIIGIHYNNYFLLMSGWFPGFNGATAKSLRLFLERNYGRSISHRGKHIIITDMPVKINTAKKSYANRYDSLNLKKLLKGRFDEAYLSKKDRDELSRWIN